MLPWLVALIAALAAGIGLLRTRRLARRLERLSESYWEVRYDCGQLNARLARLEGGAASGPADAPEPRAQAASGGGGFVSIASLKTGTRTNPSS